MSHVGPFRSVFASLQRRTRCVSVVLIGACMAVGSAASCTGQATDRSAPGRQDVNVPPSAPDTVPADVTMDRYPGGSEVRDIVLVLFEPHTSLETRRRAITAVSGTVIGGQPNFPGEEGYYVVRVPRTASLQELLTVVGQLDSIPGVRIASPWTILRH